MSKFRELRQQYFIYLFALFISGIVCAIVFEAITVIPFTAIVVYFTFKEGASTEAYMFFFMTTSFPSIWVFGVIMKGYENGFTFGQALICYLAGHLFLLFLLPIIATPSVSIAEGVGIFVFATLILGFLLVKIVTLSDGDSNHFSHRDEWKDYQ